MKNKRLEKVIIFPNGNIAAFDENGGQMPKLQQPWLNFEGLIKLAKAIVKDKPDIEGNHHIPTSALRDYIKFYREHK